MKTGPVNESISRRGWTKQEAAKLRKYARTIRRTLKPFDACPRNARAWARRDRIEALLTQIETSTGGATAEDPSRFMRTVEELIEWFDQEHEFIRQYPIPVPDDWVRRA